MNISIKTVCAYYTPTGVVAEKVSAAKIGQYKELCSENTYELYATAEHTPAAVCVRIPVEVNADDSVFMNGYQSATESKERSVYDQMKGLDMVSAYARRIISETVGGDYSIVKYKNKPGVVHGFSYCYFRSGDTFRLFASLDESTGYTVFKYDAENSLLKVTKDIEGVEKFDGYKAMALFYAEGSEDEVFDLWFKAIHNKSEGNPPAPELVGYTTKKLEEINEDRIDRKINAVCNNFAIKPNVFIIDGKYCVGGDWLEPDEERFPVGLRDISDNIKAKEMISGLCISPFTCEKTSKIFVEHKDWLLTETNGRYVKTKKDLYVLNLDVEEVRAYIREVLHTVLFMWGFDLVKLDNLYAASLLPSGGKSRGEKMCDALHFLRECCGGKLMYTDHTPLMPAFGVADYCAISCDARSNNVPDAYAKKFYRESASVRNASADIVFRRQLNRRAFLNAPCPVSLDEKESFFDGRLNSAEQNVLTNLEGLFTSVVIMSDSSAKYDQKQKRRFKKMCDLNGKASGIKVQKAEGGYLVSYKYQGKSYVVKTH